MKIKCASCQSILTLDENKYHKESLMIQCPKCSQRLRVPLPKKVQALSVKQAEKFEVFKEADDVKPLQETKPFISEKDIGLIALWLMVAFIIFLICVAIAANS